MSGTLFGAIFGGNYGIALRGGDMRPMTQQEIMEWHQQRAVAAMRAAYDPALAAHSAMNAYPMTPRRTPGIYWTRTGGNSHRVEIVR